MYLLVVMNYVGEVDENGVPDGKGKVWYQNGDVYDGDVKGGKPDGVGSYRYSNGARYDGNWRDGAPHGFGTAVFVIAGSSRAAGEVSEETYEGDWVCGQCSGHGTYKFADGSSYTGEWVSGAPSGNGIFAHCPGDVMSVKSGGVSNYRYVGVWDSPGLPNGRGRFEATADDESGRQISYEGNWSNGLPSGEGKATFGNKSTFKGTFRLGKPHGKGVKTIGCAQKPPTYGVEYQEGVLLTSDLCIECLTNHRNSICIPCGHIFFCHGCALAFYQRHQRSGHTVYCKWCSRAVKSFVEVKDDF